MFLCAELSTCPYTYNKKKNLPCSRRVERRPWFVIRQPLSIPTNFELSVLTVCCGVYELPHRRSAQKLTYRPLTGLERFRWTPVDPCRLWLAS